MALDYTRVTQLVRAGVKRKLAIRTSDLKSFALYSLQGRGVCSFPVCLTLPLKDYISPFDYSLYFLFKKKKTSGDHRKDDKDQIEEGFSLSSPNYLQPKFLVMLFNGL